ncbi:hypothetical protein P691DRAFT_809015 [Macrolepiota fuliginosa MF-IS2]|uniref:Uncharacterized protein n=1 Tax=Macrolepiota fuliginosa MF-IS2 TaxID=1400762 RepID=A0A9P5XKS6_9AGAR|nr:hypothetical protein P691DRAFT_809015 [Macrolepiota fuliginosa MF-IS2]
MEQRLTSLLRLPPNAVLLKSSRYLPRRAVSEDTNTPVSSTGSSNEAAAHGLGTLNVVLIVLASTLIIILVISGIWLWKRKKGRRTPAKTREEPFNIDGSSVDLPTAAHSNPLYQASHITDTQLDPLSPRPFHQSQQSSTSLLTHSLLPSTLSIELAPLRSPHLWPQVLDIRAPPASAAADSDYEYLTEDGSYNGHPNSTPRSTPRHSLIRYGLPHNQSLSTPAPPLPSTPLSWSADPYTPRQEAHHPHRDSSPFSSLNTKPPQVDGARDTRSFTVTNHSYHDSLTSFSDAPRWTTDSLGFSHEKSPLRVSTVVRPLPQIPVQPKAPSSYPSEAPPGYTKDPRT